MILQRGDFAGWRVGLVPGTYFSGVEYRHAMPGTGIAGAGVLPVPMVPYCQERCERYPCASSSSGEPVNDFGGKRRAGLSGGGLLPGYGGLSLPKEAHRSAFGDGALETEG